LIDPNAGASFEQNWAKILSTGNNPMDFKYILLTHEHGDHAPGAYLRNDDGIADIFLSNADSPIILISKDGKMEYEVIKLNLGVGWSTQLIADDMNNNGLKDLIIGCRFHDRFYISYRNPDGSFQPVKSFQTSGIYFDLEVKDNASMHILEVIFKPSFKQDSLSR